MVFSFTEAYVASARLRTQQPTAASRATPADDPAHLPDHLS
jgi:hypothetical protein